MPAFKAEFADLQAALFDNGFLKSHPFRRQKLVGVANGVVQRFIRQVAGEGQVVQIFRQAASPQQQVVEMRPLSLHPSDDRGYALRKAEQDDPHVWS